jgi:hypothetical protein
VTDAGDAHDVGSLGEEAAKLFGALAGWAREHAGEAGEGLSTGSAECTVCPVCRTVHAVRQLSPEVKAHLTTAMTSLAQAAATIMATQGPRADHRGDVEHIDLADEWPEDSD